MWREIFEAYAAKHPGIEVKGEYSKWDDITRKLAADLAVGSPPELVVGASRPDFVAEEYKRGYCVEMSKVVDAIGRDDFYLSALQAWQYGGKQMAIPYGSHGPVLWYRKDIYAEKGLKPPVTWEDYMDAAEKTTDAKKGFYGAVFPYGRTWNTHLQVLNCIWSAGGFCFDIGFVIGHRRTPSNPARQIHFDAHETCSAPARSPRTRCGRSSTSSAGSRSIRGARASAPSLEPRSDARHRRVTAAHRKWRG